MTAFITEAAAAMPTRSKTRVKGLSAMSPLGLSSAGLPPAPKDQPGETNSQPTAAVPAPRKNRGRVDILESVDHGAQLVGRFAARIAAIQVVADPGAVLIGGHTVDQHVEAVTDRAALHPQTVAVDHRFNTWSRWGSGCSSRACPGSSSGAPCT